MYQAIVFLPLLGAILAAIIALAGARARFPGEGPPPAENDAADHAGHHGGPHVHADAGVIHHAHAEPHGGHDDHGHGPAEPAAAGSRTVELITTTFVMIG